MREKKWYVVVAKDRMMVAPPLRFRVPRDAIHMDPQTGRPVIGGWWPTPAQERRLHNYFCGRRGCKCHRWLALTDLYVEE
jgi:hypothetical protein